MGNRSSRSADRRRATQNSSHGTDGAVKSSTGARQQQLSQQTDVDGARQLQVNIYRSYSQLGNGSSHRVKSATPTPDFKVYRHSARPQMTAASRSMSLPRSFGRSQRLGDQSDVATMPRLRTDDMRPVARSSSRASNISSTLTTPCKVSASDFPTSDFVRRRLQLFQKSFVSSVTRLYSSLTLDVRLSCLALAVRALSDKYVRVTLADFLQTTSDDHATQLSSDFLDQCAAGRTDFVACVPDALFPGITHARNDKVCDESLLTSLCNDVMTLVAAEAGAEVARMFEYQVVLLLGAGAADASSVTLFAEHCAQRAVDYAVKVCHVVDRNTLMQGAVRGRPPKSAALYVSAVVGQRELKWNVFEIVTRPGLRRDVMLRDAMTDLGVSPWQFMTSSHCEPMLYGYRGEMIDWDFVAGVYRVNAHDEASFSDEMTYRYDDFHRCYAPYYRLVGAAAMRRYLTAAAGNVRLQQYLTQLSDDAGYASGTVMPVYRPLELVEMELARGDIDIGSVDAPRQLLATLRPTMSGKDVRRAKSCVTASSRSADDDAPVLSTYHDNFLAVSHVQQTGV